MFKIGDKVITSTGEVGVITDFCTCDCCESRGFYEPKIKTTLGTCCIYCTDTDKRDNFSSFYQIGDQVYGNIDENSLLGQIDATMSRIYEEQNNLRQLNQQLKVIHALKRKGDKK